MNRWTQMHCMWCTETADLQKCIKEEALNFSLLEALHISEGMTIPLVVPMQ